jgi:phosphatidylserine/phosphatidylglycerophosphate/cardiolipin synthase-like enzyme
MVIDRETVITGSFNFTRSAELENAENLLVIHDKDLAQHYANNWEDHFRHAQPAPAPASGGGHF